MAIWPDRDRTALNNVRYTVLQLRRRLEPGVRGTGSFVAAAPGGYRLDAAHVSVDADAFEASVGRGLRALAENDADQALEHLHRAVALYRGPFVADEPYAEWLFGERDRLQSLAGEAFTELARLQERSGELTEAISTLREFTALEPLDIVLEDWLLGLLHRAGHLGEAERRRRHLRSAAARCSA